MRDWVFHLILNMRINYHLEKNFVPVIEQGFFLMFVNNRTKEGEDEAS